MSARRFLVGTAGGAENPIRRSPEVAIFRLNSLRDARYASMIYALPLWLRSISSASVRFNWIANRQRLDRFLTQT